VKQLTALLLCLALCSCADVTSDEYERGAAQCHARGGVMRYTSDGMRCFINGKQVTY